MPNETQFYDTKDQGSLETIHLKIKEEGKDKNQNNQVPHLIQDTVWESDKNTREHHTQESQEVSPFPAGDHKAA